MSILPKILPRNDAQRAADIERQLINFESQFGRNLFGPIPKNHHRDFFCLDEHTWIWHEDWLDDKGNRVVLSTRYVVRPDAVIKSQNGQAYQKVEDEEFRHLFLAIKKYVSIVKNQYSQLLQPA
ncbi:MAG TPA: hypothetical protein VGF75_05945 [Candidatus Saccharimonadales bacterium]|jgi:hypothetical protein